MQQPTIAAHSTAVANLPGSPKARPSGVALRGLLEAAGGAGRRSNNVSGTMIAKHNRPYMWKVSRQPTVPSSQVMTYGQIAPPTLCPAVAMPSARPRLRSNQRMTCAISGANMQALPKRPISTPKISISWPGVST